MFIETHIVPSSVLSSPLIFDTGLRGRYGYHPHLRMKEGRLRA